MLGTFGYMAPEQRADASKVDPRADLYAVAASLYTLLTGQEPVDLHAVEVHARSFVGLPAEIADLIRKGTSYNPAERWSSAREMSEAVQALFSRFPPERVPAMDFFLGDGALPGLDFQDMESDILPELAPPKTNIAPMRGAAPESRPPERTTHSRTQPTRPRERPPWRDFALGMVLSTAGTAVGWIVWTLVLHK